MGDWWQRHRITLGVGLVGAALGSGLTLLLVRPDPPPVRVVQPTRSPTPSEARVHVSGAVATPGVYRLSVTARVSEALDAAGGPTAEGDPHALNLAATVRDGQRIEVPYRGGSASLRTEDGRGQDARGRVGLVNLNRADVAQLDALPGVGPVTARRIVDYRERVGHFERVEQLLEERLVNRGVFDQIKDLVTLD